MSVRILIVDDEPLVLRSVERILIRAGYTTATALDVAEAMQIARTTPIDAALVDYALTEETGLQVLSRLRELQPSCLRILMTGRTDFPMIVEAVNRGEVMRVVRKPFDPATLLQGLQDAFASARRMAEVATAQRQAVNHVEQEMLEDCLRHHLHLAIQPIRRATQGHATVAYEALLRPSHPVVDTPIALLQMAERHGRVLELGREVFRLAGDWLTRVPRDVGLFVNLHPLQLSDADGLARDIAPLQADAARVTFEITERSRLSDIDGWEDSIDCLERGGFSLAVDDLGAGYNGLVMLADLRPRYIKLDMSLVRHIDQEPRKQRLVQLLATFADATNALAIAEGVESEAEANTLIGCGIHLLQGYYYGRPSQELLGATSSGA